MREEGNRPAVARLERQPRRGDAAQIAVIGEEGKHLGKRARQPLRRRRLDGNISHVVNNTIKNRGTMSVREARDVDHWCRRFEDKCRSRGIRVTSQRLAVYRALAEDLSHPTADAVYARLRPAMSSLSLATVYRILESLEEEGLIRRVSTTDGVGRFDANMSVHQHLYCRLCGRLADVRVQELSDLELPGIGAGGFDAEELDIRVVGTCRECRPPKRRSLRKKSNN